MTFSVMGLGIRIIIKKVVENGSKKVNQLHRGMSNSGGGGGGGGGI